MTTANRVSPPGSDVAIAAGCTCYLFEDWIDWLDDYRYSFEVFDDCPLHGLDAALSDLTMRPRTGAGGGDAE